MFGSTLQTGAWPRPHRIIGRFLIAAAIVLGGVHEFGSEVIRPLLPIYSHTIELLDGRFTITDAHLSHEGSNEVLRFRANLARPLLVGGKEMDPFGWSRPPEGGFQITYTVGGTLQFDALLLIAVLAWPAGSAREMAWRMGIALPMGAALLLLDIPFTVVAELRNFLATAVDPNGVSDWMIASRFLMGGGGAMIALVVALLSILAGRRLSELRRQTSASAGWRRVSRQEFDAFFRAYPRALEVSPPFYRPAQRHTVHDHSLGTGRKSCVGECRVRRKETLYWIKADLASIP
jgi:hypothetical protein